MNRIIAVVISCATIFSCKSVDSSIEIGPAARADEFESALTVEGSTSEELATLGRGIMEILGGRYLSGQAIEDGGQILLATFDAGPERQIECKSHKDPATAGYRQVYAQHSSNHTYAGRRYDIKRKMRVRSLVTLRIVQVESSFVRTSIDGRHILAEIHRIYDDTGRRVGARGEIISINTGGSEVFSGGKECRSTDRLERQILEMLSTVTGS